MRIKHIKRIVSLVLVVSISLCATLLVNAESTSRYQERKESTNKIINETKCEINNTYIEKTDEAQSKNLRTVNTANCLISVMKRTDLFAFSINMRNVCPHVVTNITVHAQIAYRNSAGQIKSYAIRPQYVGALGPGTGTSLKFNWPAPLNNPIQAEVYITGQVAGQTTSAYGVLVF